MSGVSECAKQEGEARKVTQDGKVCSSQSNLPAYAIEDGVPSFICIDPDGADKDRAALSQG